MDAPSEYGGSAGLIQPAPDPYDESGDRGSVRDAAFLLRRAGLCAGALPAGTLPKPADAIGPQNAESTQAGQGADATFFPPQTSAASLGVLELLLYEHQTWNSGRAWQSATRLTATEELAP